MRYEVALFDRFVPLDRGTSSGSDTSPVQQLKQSSYQAARRYCARMGAWRRFAQKLTLRPYRVRRRPRAMPRGQGWHWTSGDPPPGINEVRAIARLSAPTPETWVAHPIDLDIGEVADGYHLIVRSISLSAQHLLFEFAFAPERAKGAEVWLNMSYGADIPISQDYMGIGDEVVYERPPLGARYAWFDFFRTDYEWMCDYFDDSEQSDSDYLRNRISRLTFDLRTGEVQLER